MRASAIARSTASLPSFTIGPDTAIALTQHFGLTPRWLDHVPIGGAAGIVSIRRAARAVQAGDADIVACVAADTNQVDTFRKTLANFSRFAQDAVYPYGAGGPNASFALIARAYMNILAPSARISASFASRNATMRSTIRTR